MDSVFWIWSSIWNEKLSLKLPTKCLLEALSSPKILKNVFTFFVNFIFSGHWENILPGGGQWGTGRVLFEWFELPELLDSAGERNSWLQLYLLSPVWVWAYLLSVLQPPDEPGDDNSQVLTLGTSLKYKSSLLVINLNDDQLPGVLMYKIAGTHKYKTID